MFERFTPQARGTVIAASGLAASHGSPSVGREHLLVALAERGEPTLAAVIPNAAEHLTGLLRQGSPEAQDQADAQALAAIGIDVDVIREAVTDTFGDDAWAKAAPRRRQPRGLIARLLPDHQPFTVGAKKTLELALREAITSGDREITATHMLRGLLRDPGPHVLAMLPPDVVAKLRAALAEG